MNRKLDKMLYPTFFMKIIDLLDFSAIFTIQIKQPGCIPLSLIVQQSNPHQYHYLFKSTSYLYVYFLV